MLEVKIRTRLREFELDVSLQASQGEILMLVGENGCGKTTILNAVAGLFTPDWGKIVLDGRVLFDSEEGINLRPEERRLGYVFQSYALFPHMSVYDNVAFGLKTRGSWKQGMTHVAKEQLEAFGIWEIRKEKISRISGGQKQRVALARALVTEPELLLLDEPLAALDLRRQASMRNELRERVRACGVPSVMVTHSPLDVSCIGDRICLVDRGRVVLQGSARKMDQWGAHPIFGGPDSGPMDESTPPGVSPGNRRSSI
ncbi:MAG: ATP-binding cassette domain-containing protein [Methanosarcinales archaeon]|nr:ATP-binding cassette domain-containing protein [Methanosarcinales archaeon]